MARVDEDRTTALFRAHLPAAVQLAYLLTNDTATAHDVAQDAFLRAASKLRVMNDPERFASYLARTVVRTVLMRRRSAEREQARAERVAQEGRTDVGDHASNTDVHLDLLSAIRTLPPRQQAALVLRYWSDLPEAEIARLIGCRPGTVKSSLARSLEALRKVMNVEV